MRVWVVTLVVCLIAFIGISRFRRSQPRYGEILPAGEMKAKYGLTAEARPVITIDPSRVPPNLRDLIPFAEQWGVGDDVIRSDMEERASAEQKRALLAELADRTHEVDAWLDSFSVRDMPDEAAHYMYMLVAFEEIRVLYPPDGAHSA